MEAKHDIKHLVAFQVAKRLIRGWSTQLSLVLVAVWITLATLLAFRRHEAFRTFVFDLGYYTQVIWNTSRGNWFVSNLKPPNSLVDHFSPALAILAPLFWVAPDARTLIVVEMIVLGIAILPAYARLRVRYPALAPFLILAFVLNPLLHQTALEEFHEVMLAVPPIVLAVYALRHDQMPLLLLALALTLLVREDMGIYVASFGLYIFACRPRRRWMGFGLVLAGLAWTLSLTVLWKPHASFGLIAPIASGHSSSVESAQGVARALVSQVLQIPADPKKVTAIFRLFLPLAGLPLLATGEQLLWAPMMVFLVAISGWFAGDVFAFRVAPLFPLLWDSIAYTVARLPPRWANLSVGLLLVGTVVGFRLWSPFPGGSHFDASLYELAEHDRIGQRLLAKIPSDASLAAQDGLGAHLTTREHVYLFPWFDHDNPPQLIVLDLAGKLTYPLMPDALRSSVLALQLDPTMQMVWEQDGYLVFRTRASSIPHQGPWLWSPWLRLEGYELAQTDVTGAFDSALINPARGGVMRVALYWTALASMTTNYTISTLLIAPDGFIVAQDDAWPGRGALATSIWEPGQMIRDMHYLHLPSGRKPETLRLVVVVYELDTLKRLSPETGYTLTVLKPK